MLEAFIIVLSDERNFYFKEPIILGAIKYDENFKLKKELVFKLKIIFILKPSFCLKISIFEAFLSLIFLAYCNQNY